MSTRRMNLQFFSQEKTEKATPKRRQESRQKGQVAKSNELPAAFILLFSFLYFYMFGDFYKTMIYDFYRIPFTQYMSIDLTAQNVLAMAKEMLMKIAWVVAPVMIIAMLTGILLNYLQIGFLFTGEPLRMKWSKINPIEGFKRLFSLRSLVEMIKSILKIVLVAAVAVYTIWGQKKEILALSTKTVGSFLTLTASLTIEIGLKIAVLLVILAVFDYLYQRFEHEKSLRMSKQDIKDEYKKAEGDPLIKSKIRERQRQMALRRMMREIPKADVVITNPTHFAVALQYDAKTMAAPTVIAKGMDYLALKIKEVAKENQVTLMEDKPLARALYAQVEIGQAVPAELFQAVAEVLAFVYRMKGKTGTK